MTVAVTARKALEKRYGVDSYQKIRAALDDLAAVGGGRAVALDDSADMSAIGVSAAAATDPQSLLVSIRALRQALSPSPTSLMLVGGDDVIPFWQVLNPVTDRGVDPDNVVFTDNLYGTDRDGSLQEMLAPPLAIGRLPDFKKSSTANFLDLISLTKANRLGRPVRPGAGAVINREWIQFSHSAGSTLPEPVDWHVSPGYVLDGSSMVDTDRQALYFNLHGFSGVAEWKGYNFTQNTYVKAAAPGSFSPQFVSGSVVFAENCYGAEIIGRTPQNSCALRLLQDGAAFVGATGLAYGSHIAPNMFLEDADLLASNFFACFFHEQRSLGVALREAKARYLADSNTPMADPFKQKTLLQFTLLGDPEWN
jgi:hypothetical protein